MNPPSASPESTNGRLSALGQIARDAGLERVAEEAADLSRRLQEGLFYVACVGQFKRGKSTVLNALVGSQVLPCGVPPVTSAITLLRHGPDLRARVRFTSGASEDIAPGDLAAYVTEAGNPGNLRRVAAVEVLLPSPLLAGGMCLIDTPGVGSVFTLNTEATWAFVPHIDAALVVLGADPPISADELALVEEIARQCNDLLFVINKADRLTDTERQEAAQFTRSVLADRLHRSDVPLFEVSATEALPGAGAAPSRDWPGLVAALERLASRSGSHLVQKAVERGTRLLGERIRHHLEERRAALLRPLEESEKRLGSLRAFVAEAEQSLGDLGYLFSGEQERLAQVLFRHKDEFLARSQPEARRELQAALQADSRLSGPARRRRAMDRARSIAEGWVERWRAEAQPLSETLYAQAAKRFTDLANGFLQQLAAAGGPSVSGLPTTISPEATFSSRSRFYFDPLASLTTQMPGVRLLDLLRPREMQTRVLERQIGEYLNMLIYANANRLEMDCDNRIIESRRRFQSEIRTALTQLVASAEDALNRAKQQKAAGSKAVNEEVLRIYTLNDRLAALGTTGDNTHG